MTAAVQTAQPATARPSTPQSTATDERGREIEALKLACSRKHEENGIVGKTLIQLAVTVAAIWAGLTVGGAVGFFLALGIFFIGGTSLTSIYNSKRAREFLDLSEALDNPNFRRFVDAHPEYPLDISISQQLYQGYLRYLDAQLAQQQPATVRS